MHRWYRLPLLAVLAAARVATAAEGPLGVAPGSRAALASAEAKALAVPSPERARAWLHTLTEEPHVAGTKADYDTAVFVRDKLREWGWQADLAEYEVLLNYPIGTPIVEIVRPVAQKLQVIEAPHLPDKDSASPAAFPAFHGYGASGDVTAQVVYANYGRPEDFQTLERLGVDVRGKIVLVRYSGGLFRGLKVYNAQKRGAAGVLIYSDPADDGYTRGDIYPVGPYRPPSAIQRGSVQFLSHGPGDPSTPGAPSLKNAPRLPFDHSNGFPLQKPGDDRGLAAVAAWEQQTGLKRADYFATIPALPISYEAAAPILTALGGASVPAGWQGGLPFAYHLGPGPVEVRLATSQHYAVRTIWNVIATIRGAQEPDRWALLGNHRDAWVYGAVDPGSGTAATLETCRALGAAVKAGWKPRRTLLYASWDAEEYGLVGSTEWAEHHRDELSAKSLFMLNVDSAVAGPEIDIDTVPSLRDLFLDAASAVNDPRTGKNLREIWVAKRRAAWANDEPLDLDPAPWSAGEAPTSGPPRFSPRAPGLGSGSDYTAFLDHLGIPAMDVNFTGRYGVYHSVYDDFYWMETFCDPEFVYHATAAKLFTIIMMRAASAEVAPLTFTPYGEALRVYVDDLRRMVARKARASDKPRIAFEGLGDLIAAVRRFQEGARALDAATAALAARDGVAPDRLEAVNSALTTLERRFLAPEGLPGRPWFKHTVYAPGLTIGYGTWPLPGLYQAITENNPRMLAEQLPILVRQLNAVSAALAEATRLATEASR